MGSTTVDPYQCPCPVPTALGDGTEEGKPQATYTGRNVSSFDCLGCVKYRVAGHSGREVYRSAQRAHPARLLGMVDMPCDHQIRTWLDPVVPAQLFPVLAVVYGALEGAGHLRRGVSSRTSC